MAQGFRWLTPHIRQVQDLHRRRLEDVFAGRPLEPIFKLGGVPWGRRPEALARQRMSMLDEPDAWLSEVLQDMETRAGLAADESMFCPLYIELQAMAVHFIDALLGARVYEHDGDIWNDPLGVAPGELEMPDLDSSPIMSKWIRLAQAAVEAGQGVLPVSMPGTSCPINVAMNVFGQPLLEAMLIDPPAGRHALRVITDVIKGVIVRGLKAIPENLRVMVVAYNRYAPPGYGFVDGCATQLLSPQQYAEFLAPLDEEILSLYPRGGMIHLCGASAQHIAAWRAMKSLASVQLNNRAADDFELYFRGLRDNQVIYVAPTPSMTVERIREISGGRRIVIQVK